MDSLSNKGFKWALALLLTAGLLLPARFMLATHPTEYVYFTDLAGGIKGANGFYETDYYMNSVKQGYKWLMENRLEKLPAHDTMTIATNCIEPMQQ